MARQGLQTLRDASRRHVLFRSVFLAVFSSALHVCSERVWPEGSSPPASYLLIVEPEGIETPRTQEVSLLAGQSFALVDKTANGLEFTPAAWDTTAIAYEKSECRFDQTVSIGSLFPAATSKLWSQVSPQSAEMAAGIKKIYKFVTPPTEELPRKAVNFCLVAYSKDAAAARTASETKGATARPGLTVVIHASASRASFGVAMASILSTLWLLTF
ncbi:conserved hypothetical protein [Neospora caninum Liverpool]|uniref:Toxoplasma gondii family A protein n=1 Tax=Neospora caninum (strain Liverpool) TaxID=572307 RepID=F0VJU9_NEOCL|nr:conserved hypothetical protein [Neospora caninum Liverpool]CBZ54010.1 conserved hypothetical protein [Neospora caninum Liverpool]CEL68014.1 TPA: hypothetical protein BN1204_037930 [Neospora caninum Liverpool]|eukprot:XP_003884042.1 conserved hypothetical protein [Neospora caninum Liverpool]